MDATQPFAAQPGRSSIGQQLERRLSEAWQGLWDSFVDPREPSWDDGADWVALGAAPAGSPLEKSPFLNEAQLRDIRDQCRALAAANEFAINGHENRISYLVGSGHTYRAAAKKGRDAPAELCQMAQAVLDEFVYANNWHRRQQEIVRRYDAMHAGDPTRPVYLNLGQGVAYEEYIGRGVCSGHLEHYAEYARGADIVSFDIYPVNSEYDPVRGNLWYVPQGIDRLREAVDYEKPVWNWIECTRISDTGARPTPEQVEALEALGYAGGAKDEDDGDGGQDPSSESTEDE